MCTSKPVNAFLSVAFGWIPARVALGILSLLGFINLFMVRLNLSIIIVAMIKGSGGSSSDNPSSLAACHSNALTNSSTDQELEADANHSTPKPIIHTQQDEETLLDWSETIQGTVLGSFYYGYAMTQVVGGRAAELYGTKRVFGVCILTGAVGSALTPIAAKLHYGVVIALRVIMGICQGVSWPSMQVLVTRWIPPLERPRFISYVYLASTFSLSITLPLCGVLIEKYGWEPTFYITSLPSLVWCLAWFTLVYDFPNQHPRISEREATYIVTKVQERGTYMKERKGRSERSVPWRSLASSVPFWAILMHSIANNWGTAFFLIQLPTYMRNFLGFSIKANGFFSALPFISRYVGGILFSTLVDFTTSRNYISLLASRKLCCAISMLMPAAMLLWLIHSGCQWELAVSLMCVALFCNGAITVSYLTNHSDIAPNFAGTTFGIDNTLGSIISFVVPVVVGVLTEGEQTLAKWRKVFWTCVGMYSLPTVFYFFFASTSVQPWNSLQPTHDDVTTELGGLTDQLDGKDQEETTVSS